MAENREERMSYSRVECFEKCPFQYRLRYRDNLRTLPTYDAQDPLIVGNAFHMAIETSPEQAVEWYKSQYPIVTDLHIEECMKLLRIGTLAKTVVDSLSAGSAPIYEYGVYDEEYDWIGYMDCLIPRANGVFTLLDFKYASSVDRYITSPQLAIYRHMLKRRGYTVSDAYFVVAPKINIRRKKDETDEEFRMRLNGELDAYTAEDIHLIRPTIDGAKAVREYIKAMKEIRSTEEFPRNHTRLCSWCAYQRYCESEGKDLTDIDI